MGKVELLVAPRTKTATVEEAHYLTLIGHFMVVESVMDKVELPVDPRTSTTTMGEVHYSTLIRQCAVLPLSHLELELA